jgi:hypothetical protein
VRRAVAYAINRTSIITARGGFATPVTSFIAPRSSSSRSRRRPR